ncbi:tyrosine-type recombinase/integrase [Halosquirtibacter xylanolyticus]|uniref:tyrosine-type recombinase/integrase n=1 Tax=Halosquirtibacter xylanolyticus TaxID=3374599 RepID=UPI0037478CCC|nr:tyrosine-type recombinase/integrase [Prolixibacteraceae bacterium]
MGLDDFINFLQYEKRLSSYTVVAYRIDLNQFCSFAEDMVDSFDWREVDSFLVREWVVYLMGKGMAPRTVHRKISALKSMYRFFLVNEYVEKDPTSLVVLPKIRKKLPFFVRIREMDNLLDHDWFSSDFSGLRDRAILHVFYGTGMRLSELVGLQIQNIDLSQKKMKVLGKGNKERIIPFNDELCHVVSSYLEARKSVFGDLEGVLFLTDKGEQVYHKFVYRVVKRYLAKVSTVSKKSPHVLRHSYATHMMNSGADLRAIQELLGHASLASTEVYTHTTFEKLRKVYKQAHTRG